MRVVGALAVTGLLFAGCGRVDEDAAPSTTAAPVAPSDPPVETTSAATTPPVGSDPPAPTAAPTPPTTPPTTAAPSTSTTSTTSSSTASTTLALPRPVDPPAENGRRDPEMVLGRIEIPAIELDSELQEGIRIPTLNDGPGHWPGSAMPGEVGNVVVAGHRTSAGAEFRHLDDLVAGDEVIMTTPHGRFVYLVESIEIVGPDALWIVEQTAEHRATLFACHPPGSVSQRIVAHLRLSA